MDPGVSTKPIFALPESGPIYIGRWILRATLSISCFLRSATPLLPNGSFGKPCDRQVTIVHELST